MNFMTLHDLRCAIYSEKDCIRNSFPLKLGGFDLDLEQSYNLESKLYIINFRYRSRNLFLQIKKSKFEKFFKLYDAYLPKSFIFCTT
jgi:hypothetical protein